MKTLLLFFLMITIPAIAWGNPFLTCDKQDEGITEYKITINGQTILSPAKILEGGETELWHDLGDLPDGNYNVTVKAVNMWGESIDSDPFTFEKKLPSKSNAIRINIP